MRIVAGVFRSRQLCTPVGMDTRPTLDRVRESLFNILSAQCPGASVLDLYAGSGALALEAISRGAESAVLCDCSKDAAEAIRKNIRMLDVGDRARLLQMKDTAALSLLAAEGRVFDLVFLDPPYRMDAGQACALLADAGVLKDGALIVAEHALRTPPEPDDRFIKRDMRVYGYMGITFYRYKTGAV